MSLGLIIKQKDSKSEPNKEKKPTNNLHLSVMLREKNISDEQIRKAMPIQYRPERWVRCGGSPKTIEFISETGSIKYVLSYKDGKFKVSHRSIQDGSVESKSYTLTLRG